LFIGFGEDDNFDLKGYKEGGEVFRVKDHEKNYILREKLF